MSRNGHVFDPLCIIYQIIALQCSFYLAMGTLWGLCHVVFDTPVSLDHFFTTNYIDFLSWSGWVETLCTFLSGLLGWNICRCFLCCTYNSPFIRQLCIRSYLLAVVVEKSKNCVDFTFTLYFIHIIICAFYQVKFVVFVFESHLIRIWQNWLFSTFYLSIFPGAGSGGWFI